MGMSEIRVIEDLMEEAGVRVLPEGLSVSRPVTNWRDFVLGEKYFIRTDYNGFGLARYNIGHTQEDQVKFVFLFEAVTMRTAEYICSRAKLDWNFTLGIHRNANMNTMMAYLGITVWQAEEEPLFHTFGRPHG